MEHLVRPHLEAGSFIKAQQAIQSFMDSLPSPDSQQLAEAAYWSSQANDFANAATLYQRACQQAPEHPTYHYNLATTLRVNGDITGAENALKCHIINSPDDAEAYWLLVHLNKQQADGQRIAALKTLTNDTKPPKQQVHAWYALGKIYDDCGQDEDCFDAYASGASLRRRYLKYSVAQDEAIMQEIGATFSEQWFNQTESLDQGQGCCFIVGMPRSGSTLIENLLGAHSGVAMGGELNAFSAAMMAEVATQAKPGSVHDAIKQAASGNFGAMGQRYLEAVKDYRQANTLLTDKLPLNYLYLGLIHKALPQARIIHIERNPMDTIWSVYKHLFTHAYPFSYDLDEIAAYYLAYRRLMTHWHTLLGTQILSVSYEALIADPTSQIKRMTDFCDLSFEPECLDFYQHNQPVTTGSAVQVRQPINDRSIGQWQRFASQLSNVSDRLREAGVLTESV